MKTLLTMILLLAGVHLTAQTELSKYELITSRNIFDATRKPPQPKREPAKPKAPEPEPEPVATVTLAGVALEDGKGTAFFASSEASMKGLFELESMIGPFKLEEIASTGVELSLETESSDSVGESKFQIAVGESLSKTGSEPWQATSTGAKASIPDSPATKPDVKNGEAAEASDSPAAILKRLRERRKKELGQ